MNYIKLFLLALVATVLSFIANPIDAKTAINTDTRPVNEISNDGSVSYVVIDGHLYEVTYDDDGRIMLIEPAE